MEQEQSSVELKSFTPLLTDIKYEVDANAEIVDNRVEVILRPGTNIRPQITAEEAARLAERLYGISTREISELMSYDDKNFRILVDTNIKNPIVPNVCPHGYVLKIVNTHDSKKVKFFDGQTQLMLFLRQQGINCPKPVMNIFGKYHSIENIDGSMHLVRLLEFLPGKMFNDVLKTKHLFYQVGEFVAQIDLALKRFEHEAYDNNNNHKSLWMLDAVPELTAFLYAVNESNKQQLVQQIMNEFNGMVLSRKNEFAKGVIHGDFNEHNIVVSKATAESSDEFRVSGIIDFGDTCYSLYVFELAIAIAYMLLQTCEFDTAGYVIAGYQELRHIPANERKVLKVCVAARLCQSVVLGAYSHTMDPNNDYLLTTQANGWKMLDKLWPTSAKELDELWFDTADNYLKRSEK